MLDLSDFEIDFFSDDDYVPLVEDPEGGQEVGYFTLT
jgi:hypothetical protein